MSKRFPRRVWVLALLLAFLTSLPYFVGWLSSTDERLYNGAPVSPIGTQVDYNSHLAKMWQGYRGHLDYRILFTSEAHIALFPVQTFYVALGWLARLLPLSLPVIYHMARFACTLAMVLALWRLACQFFNEEREAWLALLFATVAGGWSWLLLIFAPQLTQAVSPIEFWLTDAFNLLGALYMPHFAAAVALQAVSVLNFQRFLRDPYDGWKGLLWLTLALAAEAIIQPYVALLLLPLLGGYALNAVFRARTLPLNRAVWLLIPFGLHLGLTVWQYALFSNNAVWSDFAAQNQTLSPNGWYYLIGYLPFIIPIAFGFGRLGDEMRRDGRWALALGWVVLVLLLAYAPLPTQRRYLLGVQTPLALLAAYGWSRAILPRFQRPRRATLTAVYLLLASVALIGMIGMNTLALAKPAAGTPAFYSADEAVAYAWLREQGNPDALVLTTFDPQTGKGSGGRLVAATGQRVYSGHWFETVAVDEKQQSVARFYAASTDDAWRMSFLQAVGIRYLWYDEDAQRQGTWNPASAAFLNPVFESPSLTVYEVKTT